jgi:hypothetical protein
VRWLVLLALLSSCNNYGNTCRGQWTQDPWTGETVCSQNVPRRTTTYNLHGISTTSTSARIPECSVRGGTADFANSSQMNRCICNCIRSGDEREPCRRSCGFYAR